MADKKQTISTVSKPIPEARPIKPRRKRKRFRSRSARITIAVLRVVAIGYLTMMVSLVLMESRLVYPGAYFKDDGSLEGRNPAVETVEYPTTDTLKIRGRLLERPQSNNFLLFLHGNGVKASWLDDWLVALAEEFNATVLAAEYRGYEDDVTPTEKGVLADCFAARDYLCQRYNKRPDEIILYGQSLGGGCAVAVASQGGAKALVLERTFDRLVDVASGKYPYLPINWLMKNRFDSVAKLTVYDGPLVVMHGTTDRLIPIKHAEALYQRAATPLKFWMPIEGLGHNDALPRDSLRAAAAKVDELIQSQQPDTSG
jgi:uncharacterized protein